MPTLSPIVEPRYINSVDVDGLWDQAKMSSQKTYSAYSPRAAWNFVIRRLEASIKGDSPLTQANKNKAAAITIRDLLAQKMYPHGDAENAAKQSAFKQNFDAHFNSSLNSKIGAPLKKEAVMTFLTKFRKETNAQLSNREEIESALTKNGRSESREVEL